MEILNQNNTKSESIKIVEKYLPSYGIISDLCEFFDIFSDVTRVRILVVLSISELSVNDIACVLDLNQTTASHQLRILKDARVVTFRRDGKNIYYKIINKYINDILLTGAIHLGF
jgi:DNA-binding transcriptional ArsR family regulator